MSHSPSINIPTDKALANHSLCTAYQTSLMGIYSVCLCVCAEWGEREKFLDLVGTIWTYVFWKVLFLAEEICHSNFSLSPNDSALVPAQKWDRLTMCFFSTLLLLWYTQHFYFLSFPIKKKKQQKTVTTFVSVLRFQSQGINSEVSYPDLDQKALLKMHNLTLSL